MASSSNMPTTHMISTSTERHAALPTTSTSASSASSAASRAYRQWQIQEYPLQLWWLIVSVIGFVMFLHLGKLLGDALRKHRGIKALQARNNEKEGEPVTPGRSVALSLRHLPSTFASAWRIALYRWTAPVGKLYRMTVVEISFATVYLLAILIWGFVNSGGSAQNWANRCGWLAICQMALVVGLASKNSVLSFLTGISHEKFNVLHRAAGRATIVLLWCHFFGRWSLGFTGNNSITTPRIIWGIVGLTAFTLTALINIRPLRNNFYEFVLISHIVLIFLALFASSKHMTQAAYWIWPSFALWALDRFCRVTRLLILNRLWLDLLPHRSNTSSAAVVERLSDDTLRLSVPRHMYWRAGQHAYLIMPGVSAFPFEAHPFTIASVPHRMEGDESGERELTFIVRARDGFTKRLMRHANKEGGANIKALVDGPYGCPPSLTSYTTVVLIAGGSGISYTLAQLLDLMHHARAGTSVVQRISFVWVIRHAAHVHWIASSLTDAITSAPSTLDLAITIHVTHQPSPSSAASTSEPMEKLDGTSTASTAAEEDIQALEGFPQVLYRDGRPDVRELLKGEIEASLGPVSVDVCGPQSLTRSVRGALARNDIAGPGGVLRGRAPVELHTETFGW